MAVDPVCGMDVDEKNAPATATYQGRTYYFCSDSCRTKFQNAPERYVPSGAPGR